MQARFGNLRRIPCESLSSPESFDAPVAQWLEQAALNRRVVGSIPTRSTKENDEICAHIQDGAIAAAVAALTGSTIRGTRVSATRTARR